MKAVLCTGFTGPEGLEIGEADEPVPATDEILFDVHAASVSYMDYLLISGGYQMRPETPFVPGTEAAGIVVEVGSAVTRFKPGDRVAWCGWTGGFGERAVGKEWRSAIVPDGAEFVPAATVIHNYGTAYYALVLRARLKAGETVFVTGASGGVGLACVDVAHHLGARVIAGVSSDEKAEFVREHGADEAINYGTGDLRSSIKSLTDGRGVDVCVENIGGATFETMARLMAWGGRLMPIGFTSGEIPKVAMNLPLLKNYSIVGVFMGAWSEKFKEESAQCNETIMAWLAEGHINPYVDRVLPLEGVAQAMAAIAERTVRGRTVLTLK